MKKHRKRILSLALSVLLVLPLVACRQNPEPGTSTPSSANPGASTPPKLDTRPDSPVVRDLGSAERTSECEVAETENGFYLQFQNILYYADKSDLTNWVPVCNEPDCEHDLDSCTAHNLLSSSFWLRDGRIYSVRDLQEIEPNSAANFGICSSAADGTDFRVDLPMADMIPSDLACSYSHTATPDAMYQGYSTMDNDGNFRLAVDRLDRNGRTNLLEEIGSGGDPESVIDVHLISGYGQRKIYGDLTAYCSLLAPPDEIFEHLYRIMPDGFEEIEGIDALEPHEFHGAKLDGDVLYYFVPGDGYYYMQLSTGKSTRWMDAQLPDSRAFQLGTDCILELNFYYQSTCTDAPQLRLFDGSKWHNIAVPAERLPSTRLGSGPLALCSDCLFFTVLYKETDPETSEVVALAEDLYRIDLTSDNPTLTPCATFRNTY